MQMNMAEKSSLCEMRGDLENFKKLGLIFSKAIEHISDFVRGFLLKRLLLVVQLVTYIAP
jgi:hypothetical protein